MTPTLEQDAPKAARILRAARELGLRHGFRKVTIAEIARAAGVGKGTVYLYWPSKESLVLGVCGREIVSWLDQVIDRLAEEPDCVHLRRLAPMILNSTLGHPLTRRMMTGDADLAHVLAQRDEAREVLERTKAGAMCHAVMPVLREHGLVRDDELPESQSYALHAVLYGFLMTLADPAAAGPLSVDDPDLIISQVIGRLVEPDDAPDPDPAAVAAAARGTRDVFAGIREAVLGLLVAA
ncbi:MULTISPECIES: TetR/AcrR family transcriptional regulator [Streptomyces]|uniref:TetR/AcrR family transcriptional regulator n=1 Tax=Streptomyces TaxID=1883 RepID=UPI00240DF205|nr:MULTISPECIES: TetR/AcrR family transcriptional regulator [Streptomyces]WFB88466.1 TetR/AcrR family transcriptional regulator [Streptomyces olivaceus]WGK50909.1 TetR/AcrR family transcriptional regulator [Streptomyces sp. B146]